MAGWIYFKGQGTPLQLWGRGRIKGEAALSLLYLVADAPEALVTRSYYRAPRPERGPTFTSRDRDPLLQPPRQWALWTPASLSGQGLPPSPRGARIPPPRPAFAPRAGTPARPSWGREGPGRAPASRPFPGREKLSRRANAEGNRGHAGGIHSAPARDAGAGPTRAAGGAWGSAPISARPAGSRAPSPRGACREPIEEGGGESGKPARAGGRRCAGAERGPAPGLAARPYLKGGRRGEPMGGERARTGRGGARPRMWLRRPLLPRVLLRDPGRAPPLARWSPREPLGRR